MSKRRLAFTCALMTSATMTSGAARVAAVTLQVAGVPGVYQLRLSYGNYYSAALTRSPGRAGVVR
ncbi:MAG: hypothetical protein HY718_11195 [Planctomycetes bacterium]|nr:hypothetical protein [Planctomycetota bacterium]